MRKIKPKEEVNDYMEFKEVNESLSGLDKEEIIERHYKRIKLLHEKNTQDSILGFYVVY